MINQQLEFLTPEECSELIDIYNDGEVLNSRHPLVFNIKQKISDTLRYQIIFSEELTIRKIKPKEINTEGYSWFSKDDYYQFCLGSGNRVSSAKIFLNKPKSGGGRWFPRHKLKIAPKVGKIIYWDDRTKGRYNAFTLHQDLEVFGDELYMLEVFFREKTYNPTLDQELFEEYKASGYKVSTTSISNNFYYILPTPKFTHNVGKEVQKLISFVPPNTIHQSPELAKLLLNSINPTVQRVYEGATPFKVEEIKTFRQGQSVGLWKKSNIPNILNCLVILENPPHRNKPWTFYIKGPNGESQEENLQEGSILMYPMDQVKVSLKDPFDGLAYTILELQYKLKA